MINTQTNGAGRPERNWKNDLGAALVVAAEAPWIYFSVKNYDGLTRDLSIAISLLLVAYVLKKTAPSKDCLSEYYGRIFKRAENNAGDNALSANLVPPAETNNPLNNPSNI